MFVVDDETLLTMLELPVLENSDGFDTKTPMSQVRIILRDLSGKACWDATNLLSESPYGYIGYFIKYIQVELLLYSSMTYWLPESDEISLQVPSTRPSDEQGFQSAITGSFFPQIGPRLTVRHRNVGYLPTVENSAEDLDNLDDVSSISLFRIINLPSGNLL